MKMKMVYKISAAVLFGLLAAETVSAQAQAPRRFPPSAYTETPESTGPIEAVITFRFLPGDDMFYLPREGSQAEIQNQAELDRLYEATDVRRPRIEAGERVVFVDGYSESPRTESQNRYLAYLRASRVKSQLILDKGLLEKHFVTRNFPGAYTDANGVTHKDIVVVTFRTPDGEPEPQEEAVVVEEEVFVIEVAPEPEPVVDILPEPAKERKSCCFVIRTNLLYDAFLLPTLGVEWRVNRHVGIKLDGSLSWWGNPRGRVQKVWMFSPEVRWYLGDAKRWYVGAGGNYAEYNVYGFLIGGLFGRGNQGKLWNAGVVAGYQLPLASRLSLDFNLGLGYTRSEYDSFTMVDGVRTYHRKDKTKNFWGPTQAGVSLTWTIGKTK